MAACKEMLCHDETYIDHECKKHVHNGNVAFGLGKALFVNRTKKDGGNECDSPRSRICFTHFYSDIVVNH